MKNSVLWNSLWKQINDWLKLRRDFSRQSHGFDFSYLTKKCTLLGWLLKHIAIGLVTPELLFLQLWWNNIPQIFSLALSRFWFCGFSDAVHRLLFSVIMRQCNAVWRAQEPSILLYYEKKNNKKAIRKFSLSFFDCFTGNAFFFQHQTALHSFCYPWGHAHCISVRYFLI